MMRLQKTQPDPDRDLLAEIERLEPLAKAEQNAGSGHNPWAGKTDELTAARARLDAARAGREAEAQAESVRRYQDVLERRKNLVPKLAELDAMLGAFSETTREYFKKANGRALWIDRPAGMGNFPVHGGQQRDSRGRIIDVSPLSASTGRKIVPDEEWDAVKKNRDLFLERWGPASELAAIDRDLRDMVIKNPALAFVKARQAVTA